MANPGVVYYPEADISNIGEDERKDLLQILECIRTLRTAGGWGVVEVTFKGGDIDEIITSVRKKPKFEY